MTTLGTASASSVGAMGPSSSRAIVRSIGVMGHLPVTCYFIVTSLSVNRGIYCGHGATLRPGLPGREVARPRRRPLDAAARARSAAGAATLPGSAGGAAGHRAPHPLPPAPAHGGARARQPAPLLPSPAPGGGTPDPA